MPGTLAVPHVEPFQTSPSVLVVVGPLTCGKNQVLVGDELPMMASLTVSPVRLSTDGGGVTDVHPLPSQCSASSDWPAVPETQALSGPDTERAWGCAYDGAPSTWLMVQPGVLAAWAGMNPAVRVSAAGAAGSAARQVKRGRRGRGRAGTMFPFFPPPGCFRQKADWWEMSMAASQAGRHRASRRAAVS